MANHFDFKKLKERQMVSLKEATYQVNNKKKGAMIFDHEIEAMIKSLETQALKKGERVKILVRGLNGTGIRTLKGYNEVYGARHEEDDYWLGKVKYSEKFTTYYQLQITVQKEK
jgi:hypothetical protein